MRTSARTVTVLARQRSPEWPGQRSSRQPPRGSRSTFPPGVDLKKSPCARATTRVRRTRVRACGPSRGCGSPDAILHLRPGTPTRRRQPSGRSRSSAGCRRRDAAAKRGSGRSGHGRPAEPRRQGCGGRERARWWRGAGSFAVTPTSDDRYGWSGVESWRNGALTDSQQHSQDYSQQCSQTSSRDGFFGSTTHSNPHSNTHRPRSQPCE